MNFEGPLEHNQEVPDISALMDVVVGNYETVLAELDSEITRIEEFGKGDKLNRNLHNSYIEGCETTILCGIFPVKKDNVFRLIANKRSLYEGAELDQEKLVIDDFAVGYSVKRGKITRLCNKTTEIYSYPVEAWRSTDGTGPIIYKNSKNVVSYRTGNGYSMRWLVSNKKPGADEMLKQTIIARDLMRYTSFINHNSLETSVNFWSY